MADGKGTNEKLKALRDSYARQLPSKAEQLAGAWEKCLGAGEWTLLEETVRMAHTLAGSAASFGFTPVGTPARTIENLLKPYRAGETPPPEDVINRVSEALDELKSNSRKATESPDQGDAEAIGVSARAVPLAGEQKVVFLVEEDAILLQNLALQFGHYGYQVRAFTELETMRREMEHVTPSAIIMEILPPELKRADAALVRDMRDAEKQIPVIFISSSNDIDSRLQAVRAGGDAYFIKPVNVGSLIDKLDSLTADRGTSEPYRILIVDDDPDLSSYYSLILQDAGMTTAIENNPLQIMSSLIEFKPDLILMDMYMPDCTGLELAKVIRQMGSYLSIPIVFLSGETDLDKQLSAMRTGGDDFLTKPIQPAHLISSVVTRAERMRIIRSFMERDGLTGLLNHTRSKEHLAIALERVKRLRSSLAFAMIDIDRFKSINDTYGHPTGDRVIISLARLLQQRLRKTDIIGRFGGEEFAVVLNDTDVTCAEKIMNEVRTNFSKIVHQFEDKEFTVTFSCGIAMSTHFCDAPLIINASDKALYKAKNGGRNQVVIANGLE